MPPRLPRIKKLEAVRNRKQSEKFGNKVKALTVHSVTAPAAGRNVAVKCVCLMPVGPVLWMEFMKKSSKGSGSAFWQLVVRQEPWDLLQKELGPAAAAVGGRCWEALLLRPLGWSLGPAAEQ